MMNHGFYSDDDDDEDFFGDSNPRRTPATTNPFRSNDLLDGPPTSGIMTHQPLNIPDPHSGMTGSLEIPTPPPLPYNANPTPLPLSGTMDSNNQFAPRSFGGPHTNSSNNATGGYGGTDEVASTPPGRLAWCFSCFRIDRYQQFFDMDTADIAARVKASLTQFYQPDQFRTAVVGESNSGDGALKGSDLYGPLWISMTLVFVLGVTGNISSYLQHQKQNNAMDQFEYDLNHLVRAGSIVFSFAIALPLALSIATTCMGMPAISWDMWMCCYGYAQTPFLLAALVAWIPLALIEWIAVGAATVVSVLLIVRNLSTPLMSQDNASAAKAAPVIFFIFGAHFVYFLAIKFAFY